MQAAIVFRGRQIMHAVDEDSLKDLNEAEKTLVRACAAGTFAQITGEDPIRSSVVRALVCKDGFEGRAPWPVTPYGVQFGQATLKGELSLAHCNIGVPLAIWNCNVPDGIDLTYARTRALVFSHSRIKTYFSIASATIDGDFNANYAEFDCPTATALFAASCKVKEFIIDGATLNGCFDICSAVIEGSLSSNGTHFICNHDDAIRAQSVTMESWFMRPHEMPDGKTRAARVEGGINLISGSVKVSLEFFGAQISALSRIAMAASSLTVGNSIFLAGDCRFDGTLVLRRAKVTGRVEIDVAYLYSSAAARARTTDPLTSTPKQQRFYNDNEWDNCALDLSLAEIGQLTLPKNKSYQPRGVIDLSRAMVRTFTDHAETWPRPVERRNRQAKSRQADHLILDGFEYQYLENPDGLPGPGQHDIAKQRIKWLHAQSRDDLFSQFRPQPWKQLTKVLSAQGYEEEARKIAIERRVALRYAEGSRRVQNMVSSALHLLADYGFNPWKTFRWSIATVVVFGFIYWAAVYFGCSGHVLFCEGQTVFVRTLSSDFAAPDGKDISAIYPAFNPFLYSLDTFLPILNLGTEPYWRPNENYWVAWRGIEWPIGHLLLAIYVFEQIFGALLVSLMITGFTGLLTRDER